MHRACELAARRVLTCCESAEQQNFTAASQLRQCTCCLVITAAAACHAESAQPSCCLPCMLLTATASAGLHAVCPVGEQAVGQYLDKCGTCPGSTYKNSTGAAACRKCPAGTVINSTAPADHDSIDDCVCSAGRQLVNNNCVVCGANAYKPSAGNGACITCPDGSFTTGNQATQHDELADCRCQPGAFMNAAGRCEVCGNDTYSDAAGSARCTSCPSGFITIGDTRAQHDSILDCVCPAGTQVSNTSATATTGQTCKVCPDNTFQPSPSLQPCQRCPDGTVTLGNTAADHNSATSCTCIAGQYKVGSSCVTCPANTFKAAPGEAGCVACPPGTATFNTSEPTHHDSSADCRTGEICIASQCCSIQSCMACETLIDCGDATSCIRTRGKAWAARGGGGGGWLRAPEHAGSVYPMMPECVIEYQRF
jgi:hypothetical protein